MDRSYLDETLDDPESEGTNYRRPLRIWRPLERLDPKTRSRGFVFRAPTRALYELWRRAQRW